MAREYFKKLQEAKGSRSVVSNSACQAQVLYKTDIANQL